MDTDLTNKELFASNFCHPPTTNNWEQAAPKCLAMMTQQTCKSAQCVWSTAKEFIPDSEFCAAAEISQDAMTFKTCADFQTEILCAAPICKWNTVPAVVEEGDCVSIDRNSASYDATVDNCMNLKTHDKCSNL
jgi:hypothetical protein